MCAGTHRYMQVCMSGWAFLLIALKDGLNVLWRIGIGQLRSYDEQTGFSCGPKNETKRTLKRLCICAHAHSSLEDPCAVYTYKESTVIYPIHTHVELTNSHTDAKRSNNDGLMVSHLAFLFSWIEFFPDKGIWLRYVYVRTQVCDVYFICIKLIYLFWLMLSSIRKATSMSVKRITGQKLGNDVHDGVPSTSNILQRHGMTRRSLISSHRCCRVKANFPSKGYQQRRKQCKRKIRPSLGQHKLSGSQVAKLELVNETSCFAWPRATALPTVT